MFRDSNRKRTKSKPNAHDNPKRKYNDKDKKNNVVSTINGTNISNTPSTQSQLKFVGSFKKYNNFNETKTPANRVMKNNNNKCEDFSTLLMSTNNSDYSNTDSRLLTESLTDKQTSSSQSASNKPSTDKVNARLRSTLCQSLVSLNDNKVPVASEAGSKWSIFLEVEDENNESEDEDIF